MSEDPPFSKRPASLSSAGIGGSFGGDSESAASRARDSDPPSGSFGGEDFLFHLYRGSELLQDNCVEEAKEELERALNLQPRDIEGQGLLGVVYFRLGLYPRAIGIYEQIVRTCPTLSTPRLNLALCYLKTAQYALARVELEEAIRLSPDHKRAWAYLGLVFERLGDLTKAIAAFERAEQPHMVRRMQASLDRQDAEIVETTHDSAPPERAEMRRAAADAVHELEHGKEPFEQAHEQQSSASRSGRWRTIELGQETVPPAPRSTRSPSLVGRFGPAVPSVPVPELAQSLRAPASVPPMPSADPVTMARDFLLMFPDDTAVVTTPDGYVLASTHEGFAVRVDRLGATLPVGPYFPHTILRRHARGRDSDELLGEPQHSFAMLEGSGKLVLRPPPGRKLVAVAIEETFVYLREADLVGFDSGVRYENGRLSLTNNESVSLVQLSGRGSVVFEAGAQLRALEVSAERPVNVLGRSVVGWTGRLLALGTPAEHVPLGAKGFVTFSGDGAVFIDEERTP